MHCFFPEHKNDTSTVLVRHDEFVRTETSFCETGRISVIAARILQVRTAPGRDLSTIDRLTVAFVYGDCKSEAMNSLVHNKLWSIAGNAAYRYMTRDNLDAVVFLRSAKRGSPINAKNLVIYSAGAGRCHRLKAVLWEVVLTCGFWLKSWIRKRSERDSALL